MLGWDSERPVAIVGRTQQPHAAPTAPRTARLAEAGRAAAERFAAVGAADFMVWMHHAPQPAGDAHAGLALAVVEQAQLDRLVARLIGLCLTVRVDGRGEFGIADGVDERVEIGILSSRPNAFSDSM